MIRAAFAPLAVVVSALALVACGPAPAPEAPAAETPAATAAPAGLEAFLRGLNADGGELTYAFAPVDLNGDGTEEVLAYVMGPTACGSGGCSLYVLATQEGGWRVITRTTVTQTPIGVLPTSTGGWRDLAVSVGGGGAEAGWVRLAYDGRSYPTNPTTLPLLDGQPDVTTLIASEPEALVLP